MKEKMTTMLLSFMTLFSVTACVRLAGTGAAEELTAKVPDMSSNHIINDDPIKKMDSLEDALHTSSEEMAATLNNTCWVGMDSVNYTCYSMGFCDGKAAFYSSSEAEAPFNGYWNIGPDSLYFYENAGCTVLNNKIAWDYDKRNDVMTLNHSIIMIPVNGNLDTAESAMKQYSSAARIGKRLNNTVWAGFNGIGTTALGITLKDGQYHMEIADANGMVENYTGKWAIDHSCIYLFDKEHTLINTLSWSEEKNGTELCFLLNSSDTAYHLSKTNAADLKDALRTFRKDLAASKREY